MTDERPAPPGEMRRQDRVIAFLGAGLAQLPSRAASVAALSSARRAVAAHQVRGEPLNEWLASEIHVRGIRENAATLAVMEVTGYRQQAALAYASEHPGRREVLNHLLATFA